MVKRRLWEGFEYYVPGAPDIFILLGLMFVGAVIGNLLAFIPSLAQSQAVILLSYPVLFLPAVLYAWRRSRSNSREGRSVQIDSDNFRPLGAGLCSLLTIVATLSSAFACDAFTHILPEPPEWFTQIMEMMTEGNFAVNFISVSIFAPVLEEWLCRGMVLRGLLARKVRPVVAILVSALFFAFIHLNPWQALPAFVFACIMGYVYYRTGSLKLTMLLHFTNNTMSLVLTRIDALADMESWIEVMPVPLYWICVAACTILTVLVVKRFSRIRPAF